MEKTYEPAKIESAAQQFWLENHSFEAKEDLSREKFYCLSMLPYPSGDLHMGHVRNYTIGDVITRYHIHQGKNVLQPMGWDGFGLPAENAAIERQLPPAEWTYKNIKKMRKQFKQLGFAYDWSREVTTCDPEYYRWEQWLFLQFYKKGLAYKKNSIVNWDPIDKTVLANEQVVNGRGWRSGAPVEHREISQWFLRITQYADELLEDLDELTAWPEPVITMQRHWIGRSEGAAVLFAVEKERQKIAIFTTRPDTIMGVTYLAIAPEHPLATKMAKKSKKIAAFIKQCTHTKVAEADIMTQEKQGIPLGLHAIHPITKEKLPIWITNFVLMDYGSGAVMAVPAHDERDHEFAIKYQLPIQPVIQPTEDPWDFQQAAYTGEGILFHSDQFDDLNSKEAVPAIIQYLEHQQLGERKINYRLRDWGISRQRYWGTPIPIIYCKHCGEVPVPEEALPVILPQDLIPTGHGASLKSRASFYKTTCPKCKKAAVRETDTMDTFVESSWYYARYCSYDQHQAMLDDRAKYWTPVDQYVGGIEHAVMHLLYARFMHKLLRDQGLLNSNEPFTRLLTQGMVLKDGTKMSKSKRNVVPPQPLIKKYGADTVRLFMMFAAPPEQDLEWSDTGVEGAHRFLKKLWTYAHTVQKTILALNEQYDVKNNFDLKNSELQKARKSLHDYLAQANKDMERLQFNTVVSTSMKIFNLLATFSPTGGEEEKLFIYEGLNILLRLLSPMTPHIAHQLWRELGFGNDILAASWPKPNVRAMETHTVQMIVQINGKLRAHIQVSAEATEEKIKETALHQENIQRHIADQKIKKIILVPQKLVNIVL